MKRRKPVEFKMTLSYTGGEDLSCRVLFEDCDPRERVTDTMRYMVEMAAKSLGKTAVLALESMTPQDRWDASYYISDHNLDKLEQKTGIRVTRKRKTMAKKKTKKCAKCGCSKCRC